MGVDQLGGVRRVGNGVARFPAGDVLKHGSAEHVVRAAHIQRFRPERLQSSPGDVFTVVQDPASLRFDESRQEMAEGPGGKRIEGDDRGRLARRNSQIQLFQDFAISAPDSY